MDMALQMQIEQCAPAMNRALMAALVRRESNGNPFAIGMDGKEVPVPQPKNLVDAVTTVKELDRAGKTFSVGLAQIHISNIKQLNMSWAQAFDSCTSLRNGQKIFEIFYARAIAAGFKNGDAVFAALRGYNSGRIFAQISNNYASSIMNEAARMPTPLLRGEPVLAIRGPLGGLEQDGRSESIELFGK